MFPGPSDCFASCYAYQGYGYIYEYFWLHQVRGSSVLVTFMAELHVRTMGGAVGIVIGQAIYTSILKKKINEIPGLRGFDISPGALSESVRTLKQLPVGDSEF